MAKTREGTLIHSSANPINWGCKHTREGGHPELYGNHNHFVSLCCAYTPSRSARNRNQNSQMSENETSTLFKTHLQLTGMNLRYQKPEISP